MITKINERKNIINTFKSALGEQKKGIEKRLHYLKIMIILNLVLIVFSGGILIISIVSSLLKYNIFEWDKTALIAILSLNFSLRLPNYIYEFKLLKHLKKIDSKCEFNKIDKLNIALKSIIDNLNNKLRNEWVIIILVIAIMSMGIWRMMEESSNTYWDYMKLPILALYGIVVFRFKLMNKRLNKNINEMEKYCN